MNTPIGDSKAILDQDRLLAQHQAALTILQSRVQNPKLKDFHWLDLACGRGQIIVHLDGNLTVKARGKISYHIYDARAGYVSATKRRADHLGFKSIQQITDSLARLDSNLARKAQFDFISFTNTVHELSPKLLASTLVSCVLMLRKKGSLFVYDFESFPPDEHELGAIVWTRAEIQQITEAMLNALGIKAYIPEVGQWRHKTCNGWNVHIEEEHFGTTRKHLIKRADSAVTATEAAMTSVLKEKLKQTHQILNSFTENAPETAQEREERTAALYAYWALNRALGIQL